MGRQGACFHAYTDRQERIQVRVSVLTSHAMCTHIQARKAKKNKNQYRRIKEREREGEKGEREKKRGGQRKAIETVKDNNNRSEGEETKSVPDFLVC